MPAIAPCWFARFQKTPKTSAGNKVDAAKENAALTRDKISPGRKEAAYVASSATTNNNNFEIVTCRWLEAF